MAKTKSNKKCALKTITAVFFFLTAALAHGQTTDRSGVSEDKLKNELLQLRQSFFDAQKRGDRELLEQLLDDNFYFVHSTGVIEKRAQYIDRTVAQAARRPEIEFFDDQLFIYEGNTAIWRTRSVSRGNDRPEMNFCATDVLVKKGKQWQWVSVHSTKLLTRPQPVLISADTLRSYVGQYQIDATRNLTVTQENGLLIGQAAGIRQRELISKSVTEFIWFSPDSNVDMQVSFIRDHDGIRYAVLHSEGKEVWRAKKIN